MRLLLMKLTRLSVKSDTMPDVKVCLSLISRYVDLDLIVLG